MSVPFHLINAVSGVRISKHRRYDSDGNFIPGKCIVGDRSSIKKLMRAARHGNIPPERQVIINLAMKSAVERRHVYMSREAILREVKEAADV